MAKPIVEAARPPGLALAAAGGAVLVTGLAGVVFAFANPLAEVSLSVFVYAVPVALVGLVMGTVGAVRYAKWRRPPAT